jgi:alkylation response protein AidB-like acyl-CoA dehydrogenase
MSDYRAPVRDMLFAINELANFENVAALPGYEEASPDLVEAIIEGAAQVAGDIVAPTNWIGDQTGVRVENGRVIAPEAFRPAYKTLVEDGWLGISMDSEYGGQGLPSLLGIAIEEMLQSANLAFSLCPLLTQGAIRAIEAHASDELKAMFLPKLVSGEWAATMNLTESQAGSDLSVVSSKAVPEGDHYLVSGQKVFITWGDHDYAENIAHLVLARLPDAPEGVRGISLFLVPKFQIDAEGNSGEPNDVVPVSVEHKLGIHASPTCVMSFGDTRGSVGYLVGQPNQGLAAMFTMMNHARLGVGLEGLAVSERAYQQAASYAKERVQGAAPGHKERGPIIRHPDVRRMLMLMRSTNEAMRAIAYVTGADLDRHHKSPEKEDRDAALARVDLMTPVIKGWCTEMSQELTSLGIQVHGGMGYVEETGAAQFFRDARITTIYEGTTGIQATDFVGRKLLRDKGKAMGLLIGEMRQTVAEAAASTNDDVKAIAASLAVGVDNMEEGTKWLFANFQSDINVPFAAAVNMLMITGYVCGGWQMARAALLASKHLDAGTDEVEFYQAKLYTARFFAEHQLPRTLGHLATVKAGPGSIMAMTEEMF